MWTLHYCYFLKIFLVVSGPFYLGVYLSFIQLKCLQIQNKSLLQRALNLNKQNDQKVEKEVGLPHFSERMKAIALWSLVLGATKTKKQKKQENKNKISNSHKHSFLEPAPDVIYKLHWLWKDKAWSNKDLPEHHLGRMPSMACFRCFATQ